VKGLGLEAVERVARKWVVPVLGLETVELMAPRKRVVLVLGLEAVELMAPRKRVVLVLGLEAVAGSGFGSGWVVDFLG
jgi:hypothetical protein